MATPTDRDRCLREAAARGAAGSAAGSCAPTPFTRPRGAGIGDADNGCLTLDWADARERRRVIALAISEERQTMNLRTMPGARLAVLRRPGGGVAGWAGMDVESDPSRPELFSQFVYPEFRGNGLGALLEHVWWAFLASHGCSTGYMRMEVGSNQSLFQHRLDSGYCREVTREELGERFVSACRNCELFGGHCDQQGYLEVDVEKALAAATRARGPLDITALPIRIEVNPPSPEQTSEARLQFAT